MLSELDIRIIWNGYVAVQSLSPGTSTGSDEPIVIHLQPPSEIYKPKEKNLEEQDEIIGGWRIARNTTS